MKDFRVHVESIVRPLRAGTQRKNKMREELLSHILMAYQAELDCGVPEETARLVAKERLGDPQALREALQASVHPLEQRMWASHLNNLKSSWFERRAGESSLHYAGRWMGASCFLVVWPMLCAALTCLGPKFVRQGVHEDLLPAFFRVSAATFTVLLATAVVTGLGAVVADRLRLLNIVSPRNAANPWLMALCWLGLCAAYVSAFIGVFTLVFSFLPVAHEPIWPVFRELLRMPGTIPVLVLISGIGLAALAEGLRRERRQWMEWDSLDIGE